MTFLQPFILFGLPLILVPVIIHFLNRMRRRPQQWAAMTFLLRATRSHVSHAKLRQWLVLLFRTLAVLALLMFLARPIAGGWLGWSLSPAPDSIVLLLDRSASMETRHPNTSSTKRQTAVESLAELAEPFSQSSRFAFVDSASGQAQTLASAADLPNFPLTQPTDTSADFPMLIQTALDWLLDNDSGASEIWIASDMQTSNWRPDDPRWENLNSQFNALSPKPRVRLLPLQSIQGVNRALSIQDATRRQDNKLKLTFDILASSGPGLESFPMDVVIDGRPAQLNVTTSSDNARLQAALPLNTETNGWISASLPSDINDRDSRAFAVFGGVTSPRALVAAGSRDAALVLQAAAAAAVGAIDRVTSVSSTQEFASASLENTALIVWDLPPPDPATTGRLETFVNEGGALLVFPPAEPGDEPFFKVRFRTVDDSTNLVQIARWDQLSGPLADTEEGIPLPLDELSVERRVAIEPALRVSAAFNDGLPFLSEQPLENGSVWFAATSPSPDWSNLQDGPVLVPMLQRLAADGASRLRPVYHAACGQLPPRLNDPSWQRVDEAAPGATPSTSAGIYRSGHRLLAVNVPEEELALEFLDASQTDELLAGLAVSSFQTSDSEEQDFQGEIWRFFLIGMLAFLIAESFLILPSAPASPAGKRDGHRGEPSGTRDEQADPSTSRARARPQSAGAPT